MAGGFDTSGFVLPENNFAGLYKIGDDLEAKNKEAALLAKQQAAQRLAGEKYVNNVLGDSKALYTGTPYDPLYTKTINEAHTQAEQMFNQGVDHNSVLMAIQPLISKANDYSTAAKDFQLKNTNAQQLISKRNDIDKDEFNKEVIGNAFPIDPKTGVPDITKYDPNKDYWSDAINNGTSVLNSNGVKSWFQSFKPESDNNVYKYTDATGKSTYNRSALAYPSFMKPIEDPVTGFKGFEPKYQVAMDDANQVLHKYGEQVGQPVRLLDQSVWDAMPAENKLYYVQQVRGDIKKTGSNVPLDGQAAENYARALAYDDANTFGQSNTKTNFNNQSNDFDKYAFADYNNRLKERLYDYYGSGGSSRLNQGNVFDLFGVSSPLPLQSGGQIVNGKVYDKDGNVQSGGQIVIDKTHLPAEYTYVLTTGAKQNVPKYTTFDVGKDGTIQVAHTKNGIINREQMNDFQSQVQTKGKIAPKKTFGQNAENDDKNKKTTVKKIKISW